MITMVTTFVKLSARSCRYFASYTKLIQQTTEISSLHLTPEISLKLITPNCSLYNSKEAHPFPEDPFWAFYWPGGQAVSRYILDNPEVVKGKRVLDVGSGSGACAIAASKSGAKHVTANDIDLVSLDAIKINAEINNVDVHLCSRDRTGEQCLIYDCILLGDVFYDPEFAERLVPWLQDLARNGKKVIIGDPGRHELTKKRKTFLKLLAKYKLPENCCIENNGFSHAYVWRFI